MYLDNKAKTRAEFVKNWGASFYITCPHCHNCSEYHVNSVFAEVKDGAAPGAVIGGLVGLLGGPLGLLVGGAVGGFVTGATAKKEVENFNSYDYE